MADLTVSSAVDAFMAAANQIEMLASLNIGEINVKNYGATGNARKVTDAVLNGTTTVTSATAAFTSADVGKVVWGVETATGLKRLAQTTITSVNQPRQLPSLLLR